MQAYLRVNGYFTVAEYPVLEATRGEDHYEADPVLGVNGREADMIIGEVKEGRAVLNAAATDPAVLRAVLVRFGCCPRSQAAGLVDALLRDGTARLPIGHQVRLVAFGSSAGPAAGGRCLSIELGHVVRSLPAYLRGHWDVLRHADYTNPAFGFLVTIAKALGKGS